MHGAADIRTHQMQSELRAGGKWKNANERECTAGKDSLYPTRLHRLYMAMFYKTRTEMHVV
jgi:hypothetical protein